MTNDVIIFAVIGFFLIAAGVIMPYVQEELDQPVSDNDVSGFIDDDIGRTKDASSTSIVTIMFSVFKMFFWTFGDFGVMVEIFLLTIRLTFWFLVGRNIWVGGGG